jgi:hypothetical protein
VTTTASDDLEVKELSEIYDVLAGDAKQIVGDLEGGVRMWREAAGANAAVAGFVLILALTTYHFSAPGGIEGVAIIAAELVLAAVELGLAAAGFRKYFRLRRGYERLFERAKKLE